MFLFMINEFQGFHPSIIFHCLFFTEGEGEAEGLEMEQAVKPDHDRSQCKHLPGANC